MQNKHNMSITVSVIICLILAGVLIFISMNNNTNDNMINNTTNDNVATIKNVAKTGDTVSMNYTGRLQNGTVFDSNVDPKFKHVEPFVFTLGAGQVISGWDKGIVGMKVGEKKTLTIAPSDAYGANGIPGVIPPNSTLIFDVELVSINK
jgi:FKBP-type peptidyl-prolyl cis-trans isomerase